MFRRLFGMVLAPICWSGIAKADLQVCNLGQDVQSIAIAYDEGELYTSEGWWVVAPGKCSTVIAGDLTHRFIFWRANVSGREFDGDTYTFCTTPGVFTLKDAGGDCARQSADVSDFRRMDVGSNKNWRLDLDPPAVPGATFAPGSYGQSFMTSGLMQECSYFDDKAFCDVFVQGRQFRAYQGEGTPEVVMRYLRGQSVLTPLQFSADVLRVAGTETDVAISSVSPTAADALQDLRNRLQGTWESEDRNSIPMYDVLGLVDTIFTDGFEIGNFGVLAECPGGPAGVGPVMLRQTSNSEPTDEYPVMAPQCFDIVSLTDKRLELRDVETGNRLVFVRLF